jgi:ribosomal protein S1
MARHVGDLDEGTVSHVLPFGVVVQLDGGGRGLVHESEWDERPDIGDRMRVEVLAVDIGRDRMSLRPV